MDDIKFLNLCASLKPGDTICLKDMTSVNASSWWGLVKRRWNSEDRYVLLSRVDLQLSKIILDIRISSSQDERISIMSSMMELAFQGLRNLIVTYKEDTIFHEKLLEILSKIDKMFSLPKPESVTFTPSIPKEIPSEQEENSKDLNSNFNSKDIKHNSDDNYEIVNGPSDSIIIDRSFHGEENGVFDNAIRKIYTWSNFPQISPSFASLVPMNKTPSYDSLYEGNYSIDNSLDLDF